jgi:hypothetical protein
LKSGEVRQNFGWPQLFHLSFEIVIVGVRIDHFGFLMIETGGSKTVFL